MKKHIIFHIQLYLAKDLNYHYKLIQNMNLIFFGFQNSKQKSKVKKTSSFFRIRKRNRKRNWLSLRVLARKREMLRPLLTEIEGI